MWIFWFFLLSSLTSGGSAPAAPLPVAAEPVPAALTQEPSPASTDERWRLLGIGLGDSADEVLRMRGAPAERETDFLREGCENWLYADGSSIGLCEESVEFVQALGSSAETNINGETIPLTDEAIRRALGKPAFVAEDGWGVWRGEEAMKVFVDDGAIVSIDLFYGPCGA